MAIETGQEREAAPKLGQHWLVRRWWLAVAALVLVLWWYFAQNKPVEVAFAVAKRAPLPLTIAASGKVEGDASDLAFTGAGKIIAQYVKDGEKIVAHQLLARVEAGNGSGTDDVLVAPYDGSVVNIYRREGEVVSPGTPVMRVVRRNGLYVTAYLDSEDAAWVKPGDKFVARAGGYLARGWNLQVQNVGREAVPRDDVIGSARQVRARMKVTDSSFALPSGTAVDIDGTIEIAANTLQIPASAVVREENRTFVWRVVDSTVQQTDVLLGPNNFRAVEIKSGLNAADKVVIEGKTGLKDGQRVEATAWQEPQS